MGDKNESNIKIDIESMANGYVAMAEINLEEAEAGKYTYNDGMEIYNK